MVRRRSPASGPTPRPRDATGRPLPPGRPDELGDADPAADCDEVDDAVDRLASCVADGRFFPAHRVVLRLWRDLDPEHRELWGAVAQVTGGCVHMERENWAGAQTLLARAAGRLDRQPSPQRGLDISALADASRALAAEAAGGGGDPTVVLERLPRRR